MEEWMQSRVDDDSIQLAIQSQSIQTALEANTSKITDAGFQSFLTSAPIPRFYNNSAITSAHATATNVVATFNTNVTLDPGKMFDAATGTITVPISGFYHCWFNLSTVSSIAGGFVQLVWLSAGGGTLSQVFAVPNPGGATFQIEINTILPASGGDTIRLQIGNNTPGTLGTFASLMSAYWVAPYNTYTTSAGGS